MFIAIIWDMRVLTVFFAILFKLLLKIPLKLPVSLNTKNKTLFITLSNFLSSCQVALSDIYNRTDDC